MSLGRAAELCVTPLEEFMEFAGRHDVPLYYGLDELEEDRRTLRRLVDLALLRESLARLGLPGL